MSTLISNVLLQVICNDSTKSSSLVSSGITTTSTSASEPMDCNPTPPHSSPTHTAKSSLEGAEDISMAETGSSPTVTGTSMQVEPVHPTNCSSSTMIVECTNDGSTSLPERLGSFIAWKTLFQDKLTVLRHIWCPSMSSWIYLNLEWVCLATAVVLLLISWSLPSNGSACHNIIVQDY